MQVMQQHLLKERTVYEELSVILTDETGNRDTRQLRKYTRLDDGNRLRFLIVIDSPDEYDGVALLVTWQREMEPDVSIYLPAFGHVIRHTTLWEHGESLLGTDFSIRELLGVLPGNYSFVRREDRKIDNSDYYTVDVFNGGRGTSSSTPVMRHYIRQDNMYLLRTDYLDKYGRMVKQLTMHAPVIQGDNNWNASMQLMEDFQRRHSTLIKVNKRIISEDYVPERVFTTNWLFENKPPLEIVPAEDEELESELIDVNAGDPERLLFISQSGRNKP
jgi:hypothetical protein